MAQLVTGPPKFRHPEWTVSNQMKYANAEGERAAAERLIAESDRVRDETEARTNKTQRDVNKKLGKLNASIKVNLHYGYIKIKIKNSKTTIV